MSTVGWTSAQRNAIEFNKSERLLISAAAGSGKTAVLTERITMRALIGLVEPSRLLIMTFTKLAASQMKTEIMSSFRHLRDTTTDAQKRDQLDRLIRELPLAQISTIHSFCNHILSSYLAEFTDKNGKPYLEPGYRVLQDSEENDLRDDAIDTVLTTLYAELDRLEQYEAQRGSKSTPSTDSDRQEPVRETEEVYFHATVPRGVPDLSDEIAPFVMGDRDCSYEEWLRDFKTISLAYAPGLREQPLREAIARMLNKLRSLPHYRRLIVDAFKTYADEAATFPNDDTSQYLWELFEETLQTAASALAELRHTSHYSLLLDPESTDEKNLAHATEQMERIVALLKRSSGQSEERWDEIVRIGQTLPELVLPSLRNPLNLKSEKAIAKHNHVHQFFREVFPLAALISNKVNRKSDRNQRYISQHPPVFTVFAETARRAMLAGIGPVARFLEITLLVDNEFQRRRFERNEIIYSDFEHGALAILEKEEIRETISQLYDEIYIDEYQDTSSIQDAVISAIDRRNVFMVGDIKQSIYGFRYANPQLFSSRVKTSQPIEYGQPVAPLSRHQHGYISLMNRNFRSRPGIIDFVNDFFSAFLTESIGEIEYDATQMFEAHRSRAERTEELNPRHFPEVTWEIAINDANPVTVNADEQGDGGSTESFSLALDSKLSEVKKEAFIAARVIGELLDSGAKPETIAVLLATNDHCRQVEEVLSAYGIPVASRSGRVFPDNLVSRQVEALLAVLDNPRQDIPLLSTMIGPFAPDPFTSEELAHIGREQVNVNREQKDDAIGENIGRRVNVYFHDRLRHLCAREPSSEITLKYKLFETRMKKWRMLATELNARELLDTIFLESDYVPYISRGELGASHYTELEQLISLFDLSSRPNSFGVRSMIAQLKKALDTPVQDDTESGTLTEGAVHVLTRHSSKGLQWDYVLLGGLTQSRKGQGNDLISYSEQNGLSSCTIDNSGLTVYNNALNEVFRLSEEKRTRAESWRLFYVAMTRAKERLILLSSVKKTLNDISSNKSIFEETLRLTSHLNTSERMERAVVPESISVIAEKYLELLLSVLAVREPDKTEKIMKASEGCLFEFKYLSARVSPFSEIVADVENRTIRTCINQVDPSEVEDENTKMINDTVENIKDYLTRTIPHKEAANTPAKITVTELNKRLRDDVFSQSFDSGESPEPMAYLLQAQTSEEHRIDAVSASDEQESEGNTPTKNDIARSDMALAMREREEGEQIEGASLGTLMHYIFQFIDIENLARQATSDAERNCRSQLRSMAEANMMTREQEEAALPFIPQIVAWANSPLAERLLKVEKTTGRVYREIPFTMAIASSEFHENFPDDEITLVQGMIDLWFEEENKQAVLIDFKTDYLPFATNDDADDEMRRRYTTQIRYYADAIKKATGCDVSEALIWLVRYARPVSIALD